MNFKSIGKKFLNNKNIKTGLIPLSAIAIFFVTIVDLNNQSYGLTLECQGTPIATVSSEAVYEEANHMIMDQLNSKNSSEVINTNTQVKISPINKKQCCESPSEIKDKIIQKSQEIITEGYGVYVDGKLIAVGKDEEKLNQIKDKILENARSKNSDVNVEFKEKLEIKKGIFSPEEIKSYEDIEDILTNGIEKFSQYTVKEEDSILSIAEKFGITPEELLTINNAKEDTIKVGDKLIIKNIEKILHVNIFKIVKEEVKTEAAIETIEDSNKSAGTKEIKNEGKDGLELVTYKVQYDLNGNQIEKTEIERKIIEESISKQIVIGTKKESTEYAWPVPGSKKITSPFGKRADPHGRKSTVFHSGIDISGSNVKDKTVVASRDGKVICAKRSNKGYGNHVIIQHDNGAQTLYGHLDSISVSEGQQVGQNDKLGVEGSTGDSTGIHLHFEIRINGTAQNPQNYVKAK